MDLFLDTEFNGFQGELISIALVSSDGKEFYESLGCNNPTDWIANNVIPILQKDSISRIELQDKLEGFLSQFDEIQIIADWPEDISHFCQLLITGPGKKIVTPEISFRIDPISSESGLEHNALYDARGIKEAING